LSWLQDWYRAGLMPALAVVAAHAHDNDDDADPQAR
jgi:hypothetical protein